MCVLKYNNHSFLGCLKTGTQRLPNLLSPQSAIWCFLFLFLVPTLFPKSSSSCLCLNLRTVVYFYHSVSNVFWKAILMQDVTNHIRHSSFCYLYDILSFFDCIYFLFFSAALKMWLRAPFWGFLDHKKTHTQTVGLLWTRDQPVSAFPTYTTRTVMLAGGFEPSIPAV